MSLPPCRRQMLSRGLSPLRLRLVGRRPILEGGFWPRNMGAMLDFFAHLWIWLIACLFTGAATGALVGRVPRRQGLARWLIWATLAFLAGAAAVALGAAQGAVAASIEIALACFAAFMGGASVAASAARRSFAAHEGWALGLVPAALLCFGAAQYALPAYQSQLQARLAALTQSVEPDATGVSVSGRDAIASPRLASNKSLMAQIEGTPGVRRVHVAADSPAAPEESEKTPEATGSIATSVPDEPKSDEAPAKRPEGGLDPAACQRALDAVAASDPIAFREARATVNRRVAIALDKAAEVIRRCPDTTIEVRGHGDAELAENPLSERRAKAAERYLRREGVAGRRLVPVGCCVRAGSDRRASAIDFIVR